MYDQLVQPNTNTGSGQVGYCLSKQEDVWGTAHLYTTWPNNTAKYAWTQCQHQHPGEEPPEGVAVLLWWSYLVDGVDEGHVATQLADSTILSSPYKSGTTQAILPSRAELERIYSDNGAHPLTYLGWSEDIATLRVAEPQGVSEAMQIQTSPPVFDPDYYLTANPDVAQAGEDATEHWLNYGINEGRASTPTFHVAEYLNNYPDLQTAYGSNYADGINHWFTRGILEGRFGTSAAKQAADQTEATIQQLQTTVATITSDDTATKADLQTAISKVSDLTTQLAELKAQQSSTITPVQQAQLSTLSSIASFFKRLFGIT